jgi:RimJ/RimL family protein N-acetyltransferase
VAAEGRWLGVEVPFDRTVQRARLAEMVTADRSVILVVDAQPPGAGVVGFIDVVLAPYGVATIGMAILEPWRGRGLGRSLLDAALAWAASAGAHKVALEAWPDNEVAITLYRRAGFVEEGRKRAHYRRRNGEVWDAVLMGRPIP